MAQAFDILVKPNGNQGPTVLVGGYQGVVKVLDEDGNVIDENNRGTGGHEVFNGKPAYKYNLSSLTDSKAAYIEVNGKKYKISPGNRQTYSFGNESPMSSTPVSATAPGGGAGGVGGFGQGFAGSVPYIGDQYPEFEKITKPADVQFKYDPTDPQKFAESYGKFATDSYLKNFGKSKDIAMKTLQTELEGLQFFTPAAAALKRQETAADNVFNQRERTRQVQEVLPDVQRGLADATKDASTYSKGRFTSDQDDRALELGLRSDAADIARSRGFGDNSTAAMKASDLMSAKERFGIAQYGNQLKESNAVARQQLELAPTSYSDAGQQVRVTPTTDAGTIQRQATTELTQLNTPSVSEALQTTVQQNQFKTSGNFQADTYNSNLKVDVDKYNSTNSFAAKLGKFNYDVSYLNQGAGLAQSAANTDVKNEQLEDLKNRYENAKSDGEKSAVISSIFSLLGLGAAFFSDEIKDFIEDTTGLSLDNKPKGSTTTSTTTNPDGTTSTTTTTTTATPTTPSTTAPPEATGPSTVSPGGSTPNTGGGTSGGTGGGTNGDTARTNNAYRSDMLLNL